MRRFALWIVLCAFAWFGAPARAAEPEVREFVLEYGRNDPALRADCAARLAAWWDEAVSPERRPAKWDEAALGPWSLVARTTGGGFYAERDGLVQCIVSVSAPGVPSLREASDRFASEVLDFLRSAIAERARVLGSAATGPLDREIDELRQRERVAETDRRLREEAASPAALHDPDALAGRLAELQRDVSQTRIDRAVVAKKLEAARAAATRAVELERLRRDADAIVAQSGDAGAQGAAAEKLALLRAKIDELAATTPSLDAARDEVFRQEIERVGLEARAAVLAEEVHGTESALAESRAFRRRADDGDRALGRIRARLDEAESELLRLRADVLRAGPPSEVIRPVGPPAAKKEEKR